MATFKVGQRVKRVKTGRLIFGFLRVPAMLHPIPLGTTGTIIANKWDPFVEVRWDVSLLPDYANVYAWTLAPLTDPKADAFLESIRKMKPYSEPTLVPDPAHHGDKLRITLPDRY